MASFLVIRASGYLEQVVIECIRAYSMSKSDSRVTAYTASWVTGGLNPKPGKLEELVRRFDGDWAQDLAELLDADDQRLRRELGLLVDRRNKIAHGLNEGMSARKALSLADDASEMADWFIERFDPR